MSSQYLLLSEIFPPRTGGSGRWFWDLYTRIEKDKVIVATDMVEEADCFDIQTDLTIKRTRFSSKTWGVINLVGLRFYISLVWYVLKLVKKHNIQSIHCGRTLHEGVVAMVVKFLTGTPYLCYVHGEDVEMCWSSREFVFLVNAVLKHASILICNSHNSANLLRKWKKHDESKLRVLHPGVDANSFVPDNNGNNRSKDQKIILTVSRLQPRKGHDVMIKAMPKIIQRHPDARYVIIGSGTQHDFLANLIDELNLEEYVSLLGECSDSEIQDWYQRSDLFVLPNRQIGNDVEGFGIVLLEAQASKTAVIAGDSGGTRETMKIGETGFILDCRSKGPLVQKINELFDDPGRLQAMGEKGREWILSTFDWPVIIGSARQIFSEVDKRSHR